MIFGVKKQDWIHKNKGEMTCGHFPFGNINLELKLISY